MTDSGQPPPTDRLREFVEAGDADGVAASLERVAGADTETKKEVLRQLRSLGSEHPRAISENVTVLARFLEDDDRSVRLATAKLLATIAERDPERVAGVVPALADRLADDGEFYYVRARCAETLGYVALEDADAVASPEILAELRVGLSFDKPEVREKLAKALECVALGDPDRLRHQVPTLADHLDDDTDLVRYHLTTALVAVGCASPDRLADATDALVGRLDDETAHVRGRAAEALGLLARADGDDLVLPESELRDLHAGENGDPFVDERVRFALDAMADATSDPPVDVGTLEGVRATTADAVEAITAPDHDGECPHCGLALPVDGPPLCPRCGGPY